MKPTLAILVVDDEDPFREIVVRKLAENGDRVVGARDAETALGLFGDEPFDVAILDVSMPGMSGIDLLRQLKEREPALEAIMLTGHGTIATAIEAMRLGAYDYLEKPVKFSELILVIEKAAEKKRLRAENTDLKEVLRRTRPNEPIVGASPAIRDLQALLDRVSPTSSPVLIEGESGTGKELVARAIHARSTRARGTFLAVNCGSFSEQLLEDELFGHKKGAYTGATSDRKGLFEVAHQGTLFIDEVCEMDMGCQKKFLRVLESGEFRRLGETATRQADVRIVAATNRRMQDEVAQGRFREDLYYRLNVVAIRVPPLRERTQDIPLLVDHFLQKLKGLRHEPLSVSPEAMAEMPRYAWPGNVRELANLIERAVILSRDGIIRPSDLPFKATPSLARTEPQPAGPSSPQPPQGPGGFTLDTLESDHVRRVLDAHGGNKTRAAKALGISLRSLYRKLDKHGLR